MARGEVLVADAWDSAEDGVDLGEAVAARDGGARRVCQAERDDGEDDGEGDINAEDFRNVGGGDGDCEDGDDDGDGRRRRGGGRRRRAPLDHHGHCFILPLVHHHDDDDKNMPYDRRQTTNDINKTTEKTTSNGLHPGPGCRSFDRADNNERRTTNGEQRTANNERRTTTMTTTKRTSLDHHGHCSFLPPVAPDGVVPPRNDAYTLID